MVTVPAVPRTPVPVRDPAKNPLLDEEFNENCVADVLVVWLPQASSNWKVSATFAVALAGGGFGVEDEAIATCEAGPGPVGVKLLLVAVPGSAEGEVKFGEDTVRLYCVFITPPNVQPSKSPSPSTIWMVRLGQLSVPPLTANVAVENAVVTTLPPESSNETIGAVVKAEPATPAAGSVVNTICVATPGPVGENALLVAESRGDDDAVMVYCVPTRPEKVQLVTFTTPFTAFRLVHSDKLPPEDASVMAAVDDVTTFPF
jgi:hypothetical protein